MLLDVIGDNKKENYEQPEEGDVEQCNWVHKLGFYFPFASAALQLPRPGLLLRRFGWQLSGAMAVGRFATLLSGHDHRERTAERGMRKS